MIHRPMKPARPSHKRRRDQYGRAARFLYPQSSTVVDSFVQPRPPLRPSFPPARVTALNSLSRNEAACSLSRKRTLCSGGGLGPFVPPRRDGGRPTPPHSANRFRRPSAIISTSAVDSSYTGRAALS